MKLQRDELRHALLSACGKARAGGLRYPDILEEIRSVEGTVRASSRAMQMDPDRREQVQPAGRGTLRTGFQTMGALVGGVMQGARL